MKEATIHLLPELSDKTKSIFGCDEYWEMARKIDFIPDSLETVRAIYGNELMMVLMVNDNFFNAVVNLCGEIIDEMIKDEKKDIAEWYEEDPNMKETYEKIQEIVTVEDYLKMVCCPDRDPFVMDLLSYL